MQDFPVRLLFWISIFFVFYTYIGYGIILYACAKIKTHFYPEPTPSVPAELPQVTLLIAAYNEAEIIEAKMENCRQLNYPKDKLKIIWITDGSNDQTHTKLASYPEVSAYHIPERHGKTAALNRGMQFVKTSLTVFTDANTMLNPEAIREIIAPFENPQTGCVAGEKRIINHQKDTASSGGEGFYWKYESKLKAWDARLYSTVGAAGELYAIRTNLFQAMPEDTLLDDFILSMQIASQGYKIAYCSKAYAIEEGSADMKNEAKRKVRIAAGGLQAIGRLSHLLIPNPFHLGLLRFQYISHRVLRWSLTPILLFLLLPLNLLLSFWPSFSPFYSTLFLLQVLFYGMAALGYQLQQKQIRVKMLFIPYYFLFMNLNVLKAFFYLRKHKGTGTWDKAQRKQTSN